ncbi:MAG: LLM class F420-dependent oxidoreductase [Chloroflexota bacterium]|nr:LLM class F420-dependent oxidoreductase [Chloroflexota bacterium]
MQFGVTMFPADYAIPVPDLAREAEARGFDSLWLPEHTHIPTSRQSPFPGGGELPEEYKHTLDPFVALAAAATVTTRLRLGTGIALLIQRDPIVTAREVASLDFLSGGRVEFGIGAGWNREEMANHGAEYRTRWRLMRERVLAMKAIWTNEVAEYHGEFVDFDPIWQWPKPIQKPHPPIIIGGDGPKATEALLEYGDGWIPRANRGDAPLAQRIADMNRLLAERGRGPVPISVFSAPEDPSTLEEYRRLGVTRAVFRLPPADVDTVLPALDHYTELARQLT